MDRVVCLTVLLVLTMLPRLSICKRVRCRQFIRKRAARIGASSFRGTDPIDTRDGCSGAG